MSGDERSRAEQRTHWGRVRAVADAVLYEGYLLYPYRATSRKNQTRWQFGVLGPPRAAELGIGEEDTMSAQVLVDGREGAGPSVPLPFGRVVPPLRASGPPRKAGGTPTSVTVVVRFLQLQRRTAERDRGDGTFETVAELTAGPQSWLSWDEAVERELTFGPFAVSDLAGPRTEPILVGGGVDIEPVDGGRLTRERRELHGELVITTEPDGDLRRLTLVVRNTGAPVADKDEAIALSMIGTHMIVEVSDGELVSLLETPAYAAGAVERCRQHRCFPVLAGPPLERNHMLVSPIILYDYPEIAEQSEGALYDSTEIDEILTLRVMTMTDEEKAQARATDPLAAQIIDRCDSMSPEAMLNLHGVLRNPHAGGSARSDRGFDTAMPQPPGLIPEVPDGVDWWDPSADTAVQPGIDAVLVNGVRVARGSHVRLRPSRRADAQDIFFSGKAARVTSVHEDVDGNQYVGVVIEDDPAADLHEWYGRYLYFSPDEVEPLSERSSQWKQ